ncbi:MAG: hypothetical protein ACRDN9_09795 [Streptosporangiaceae bacterium]
MTAAAIVIALALLAAYLFTGIAGLAAVAAVACAGVVIALRTSLPRDPLPSRPRIRRRPEVDSDFHRYTRLQGELGWARVSPRHFDGPPRRLLLRLTADTLADHRGVDIARHPEAARELLGPDLWPLLDPDRPTSTDSDPPGVDERTIDRILTRLEEL